MQDTKIRFLMSQALREPLFPRCPRGMQLLRYDMQTSHSLSMGSERLLSLHGGPRLSLLGFFSRPLIWNVFKIQNKIRFPKDHLRCSRNKSELARTYSNTRS